MATLSHSFPGTRRSAGRPWTDAPWLTTAGSRAARAARTSSHVGSTPLILPRQYIWRVALLVPRTARRNHGLFAPDRGTADAERSAERGAGRMHGLDARAVP